MTDISMEPISRSKRDLARFFDVADRIYASDPNWVPPLRDDLAKVFSEKNPFFRHAEMQLFVASRGGRDAGRIAAILDRNHNDFHGEKTAFFGFFESENDQAVATRLFDAAAGWARQRGMEVLRGPANPSLNDEAGLLVEGFDRPPVLMMTYNPRYYPDLVERAGFHKAKDLFAYWFDIGPEPLARLVRLNERFRKRAMNIEIRKVSKRGLMADLPKIRDVYNAAWEKNWGFVPMTAEEMDFMAARLKPLVDEDFLFLAEARRPDGSLEPIAFLLALPDYNAAIQPLRGRLLPLGWLKFLLGVRKIKTLRVLTLGIKKEYRLRGIQSIIFEEGLRASLKRGLTGCEISWLLEGNDLIINSVGLWGGHLYKTYRLYDKTIS
ncbi:MAG TPA: N-acetyltransferase [Thermoanaerobaculia bacterium]|nr:N-acetyltransferase [Thermoanaerobaculia bacterium]